eukprot:scaffold25533_cov36-Tisochrysis_lutea.AAC.4
MHGCYANYGVYLWSRISRMRICALIALPIGAHVVDEGMNKTGHILMLSKAFVFVEKMPWPIVTACMLDAWPQWRCSPISAPTSFFYIRVWGEMWVESKQTACGRRVAKPHHGERGRRKPSH